jgi:hypothetical protein
MAFLALAGSRAGLKLPFVRVWLVAIHALVEREWLPEISTGMAITAAHFDVRAQQWKFRLRVFELHRRSDILPAAGVVAGFARGLEFSPMRIGVAVDAAIEF